MILLIFLAYFVIACFVTVCAEKIFEKEFEDDEDNVASMIGTFWVITVPLITCTYGLLRLGKFLCKNFRRLLNVNRC